MQLVENPKVAKECTVKNVSFHLDSPNIHCNYFLEDPSKTFYANTSIYAYSLWVW